MPSMDLVYRFLGVDAGAGREFDRMAGKATTAGSVIDKVAFGAAAAAGTVAVASIKMASDFQTSMTRLNTQANVSTKNVAVLSKGVLGMAASVASTPNQLAPAIYHIASIGQGALTTAQELRVLKIATEGAKIGGADLTDVTNALDAAIVSHIKGVKNYSQAMGVLNSTVGAGDMTMQDLADAFGPLGAVMKGYNVDIRQVGAALATLGDNNLRGAQAGTALRMSVQALAVPMKAGQAQLEAWGIKSGNLSKQLEHGGLTSALDTLQKKMRENGVTAKDQGTVLTEAFGKRAGVGLAVLMGELDRYHEKLKITTDGANGFASSWKGYTKTFGYAWDSAKAAAESMLIELGSKLLPVATKFTNWIASTAIPDLTKFAHWLAENKRWTEPLAIGLGAVGAALMVAFGGPVAVITGLAAIAAGLVAAYNHSQVFRTAVQSLEPMFRSVFGSMKSIVQSTVQIALGLWHHFGSTLVSFLTGTLKNVLTVLKGAFKFIEGVFDVVAGILTGKWSKIWTGIKDILSGAWTAIGGILHEIGTVIKTVVLGAVDVLKTGWDLAWHGIEHVFGTVASGIISGLKWLVEGALGFMGTFVNAGAKAFGWVPFVGGKLRGAAKAFDNFSTNAIDSLSNLAARAAALGTTTATSWTDGIIAGLHSGTPRVQAAAAAQAAAFDAGARHKIESRSPSRVAIRTAQTWGDGLIVGLKSKTQPVTHAARLLAEGLIGGWTGEAASLKNALTTPVRDALSKLETAIKNSLTRVQQHLKNAQSNLKQFLQAQRSSISQLQSSLAGGSDLSNIFTTDANGNPVTLNASTYLSGQVGVLRQFADDMKQAARLHLAPTLLSEIANMGAVQGDQVLKQFLSGGASIGSANQAERLIQSYAKQAATTVVMTPHEKEQLRLDTRAVALAEKQLRATEQTNRHLEHLAAKSIAGHATFEYNGRSVHLKEEDAKKIVEILHRYERQTGKKYLSS